MVIDMQILISRLCVFVTLIGIGFLTFRAGLMTAELHDKLNTIIMRVLLPALLISTMAEGADGENGCLLLQMTIIAGLPSSSMFAIMCKENGNSEVDYAARTAIITVFCSLITFPAVSMLIR